MARRQKQKKFNSKHFLGLFIVAIMILSGAGYIWSGNSNDNYGDHKFTRQPRGWSTVIDSRPLLFTYHPSDLEYLNLSTDWITQAPMAYLVFNPRDRLIGEIELARISIQSALEASNQYVVTGVTERSDTYSIYPVADCNNATTLVPVIYLKKGNQTGFLREGNCLVISAVDGYDVSAIRDRFLYSVYGVMQGN